MIQDFKGTIEEVQVLTPTVRNYVIALDKPIEFKAGQFVNLSFEENGERLLKPYSIASQPSHKDHIELCIKLVEDGRVTPHIFGKKEGFEFDIKGPVGLFTLEHVEKEKLVFIGSGTGVTPLRSMIKDLLEQGSEKELTLILGVRHDTEILFKEEFEQLEQEHPNFKFVQVVSRPSEKWEGRQGHVQNNFDMIDPLNSQVYMCGLQAMLDGAKAKLEEMGMAQEDIHFERYI